MARIEARDVLVRSRRQMSSWTPVPTGAGHDLKSPAGEDGVHEDPAPSLPSAQLRSLVDFDWRRAFEICGAGARGPCIHEEWGVCAGRHGGWRTSDGEMHGCGELRDAPGPRAETSLRVSRRSFGWFMNRSRSRRRSAIRLVVRLAGRRHGLTLGSSTVYAVMLWPGERCKRRRS